MDTEFEDLQYVNCDGVPAILVRGKNTGNLYAFEYFEKWQKANAADCATKCRLISKHAFKAIWPDIGLPEEIGEVDD
jgi:hypothetical protein